MATFTNGPLIITGMHRSGTSLLANIVSESGISLGENLMPAGRANKKGFFEDLDFVAFHNSVIRRVRTSKRFLWEPRGQIELNAEEVERARKLVATHSANGPWAFKDPRTVHFLDFWADMFPAAPFLFVFRRPELVADSLRRRDNGAMSIRIIGRSIWPGKGRLGIFLPNRALESWLTHNQQILAFMERQPDRTCLVEIEELLADPDRSVERVRTRLGVSLRTADVRGVFEAGLMTREPHPSVTRALGKRPDVTRLHERLIACAATQDALPTA